MAQVSRLAEEKQKNAIVPVRYAFDGKLSKLERKLLREMFGPKCRKD